MAKTSSSSSSGDRLGKLILAYGGAAAVLLPAVGGGALFLLGIGAVLFGRANPQHGGFPDLLGWVLVVVGALIPITGCVQGRKSFEVRRHGLRYRAGSSVTEMDWDDVETVEVEQLAAGGATIDSVDRRSGRLVSSRSLRHHYTVTVTGADGDTITLDRSFVQMGGQPKKLIEALRRGAREKFFFMEE